MNSEFYHVELDRIRYSLVWEDFRTLSEGLNCDSSDNILVITSAGCNVLNSTFLPVQSVTAIDLNPVQNALLRLKIHVIQSHDYSTFASLLGIQGKEKVQTAWATVREALPAEDQKMWADYFNDQPHGLLLTGKLERYVSPFLASLSEDIQNKVKQLINFTNATDQYAFFLEKIDRTDFQKKFITYFNETNLSKGRDLKLFKYAEEQSGETFYERLKFYLKNFTIKDNFYFRFFFFGIQGIDNILPCCYQERNYTRLKNSVHKIKIIDGEAIDYLLSDEGKTVTKASLSNIFEYITHEEFKAVCTNLVAVRPALTFVYWNLLQEQIIPENNRIKFTTLPKNIDSCFYFKNSNLIKITNP